LVYEKWKIYARLFWVWVQAKCYPIIRIQIFILMKIKAVNALRFCTVSASLYFFKAFCFLAEKLW